MGGDISCAAAGLDPRVAAAACGIATPDWLRPGSFEPPGAPDSTAMGWYHRCNPLTNLDRYRHCPAISFQNGDEDQQVPPDGADRFVAALRASHYRDCPARLESVRHPGVAHRYGDAAFAATIAWLQQHLA
jgi:hypothetical protein